jgi:hypothetical protein
MAESKQYPDVDPTQVSVIREQVPLWDSALLTLLPNGPSQINLEIKETQAEDNTWYKEGGWDHGVGGSTPTANSLVLEVDIESDIPLEDLLKYAKATYFHEKYHLARGYSFESTGLSLLDVAIEEGLATKFEIDKANGNPAFGHHQDRETMLATLEEVRAADLAGDRDWQRWKFYYPGETPHEDRRWILYRLGTFIAEEALSNNAQMEIQGLATLSREEILILAGL